MIWLAIYLAGMAFALAFNRGAHQQANFSLKEELRAAEYIVTNALAEKAKKPSRKKAITKDTQP